MKELELEEARGGYEKVDVMVKVDSYNTLIMAVENNLMTEEEVLDDLNRIRNYPLRKTKKSLFSMQMGYDIDETEAFFKKLEKEIHQKMHQ
ncbi:MAG: hypothetical protein MJ100_05420 [Ruminococcus sp.]|nr:hypothetical protein [Ruminococcus sp.]